MATIDYNLFPKNKRKEYYQLFLKDYHCVTRILDDSIFEINDVAYFY